MNITNIEMPKLDLKKKDLELLQTKKGLLKLLSKKNIDISDILEEIKYDQELEALQKELVKLQYWVQKENKRLVVLFEGNDAAGKGGTIRRFNRYLNPRSVKVVALAKPTENEKGQWYFQRYIKHLPNPGEIALFDRSWYNRAVVEPAMGFCSLEEYDCFMRQVVSFEKMLCEDGIIVIKLWLGISKKEQKNRIEERKNNVLKQWKVSPVDEKAQEQWDEFSRYRELMFKQTSFLFSPWVIVDSNDQMQGRLECIRYVLHKLNYEGKEDAEIALIPNDKLVEVVKMEA